MLVKDILRLRRVPAGDIGIEIEAEGENLPRAVRNWVAVPDGSLRGEDQIEFVLDQPVKRENLNAVLDDLHKALDDNDSTVDDSPRTSVHVHINVNHLTLPQWFNYVYLYIALEESLLGFCGEARRGNLFCLSANDAEYLFHELQQVAQFRAFDYLNDNVRYAGVNIYATKRYGSLEFRSMRGTVDKDIITGWVDILLSLREAAMSYDNPREMIEAINHEGEEDFVKRILGDEGRFITMVEGWREDFWRNMRRCKYDMYNVKWEQDVLLVEPLEDV